MNKPLYPELPILLVDDEEHFLSSLKANLRVRGINHVELCSDPREVMGRLEKKNYSLILLDLNMTYVHGADLLIQIKQKYNDMPVIICSGYGGNNNENVTTMAVKCGKLGADNYIKKEDDIDTIVAIIKDTLQTFQAERTKQIFISYSHQDKEWVQRLKNDLDQEGFRIWIDEKNIRVGNPIGEKIKTGVSSCHFFCVILSQHSIKSSWVEEECKLARKVQKKILPVLIHEVELPMILRDLKFADFSWDYERGFKQLLDAIKVD